MDIYVYGVQQHCKHVRISCAIQTTDEITRICEHRAMCTENPMKKMLNRNQPALWSNWNLAMLLISWYIYVGNGYSNKKRTIVFRRGSLVTPVHACSHIMGSNCRTSSRKVKKRKLYNIAMHCVSCPKVFLQIIAPKIGVMPWAKGENQGVGMCPPNLVQTRKKSKTTLK